MPQVEIPFNEIQNEQSSSLSSLSSSNDLSNSNDDGLLSSQSSNNLSDIEVNVLPLIHNDRQLPMYENVNIPNEPSLDELLKQVACTNDLASVEEIQLRVVSNTISLQRIHLFMPNLRVLNLEGSIVSSLRDLGCDIITLKHLNVSRCGLKSFDGTNGLGSLEELVADFNFISDISPCCSLDNFYKNRLLQNFVMPQVEIPFNEIQNEQSSSLSSLSSSNDLSNSNDDGLLSSQSSNNLSDIEVNVLPLIHNDRQLPMYENVNIPNEPSLDELLKQVACTNDLASVEEIQLRVVSNTISLQRIHLFMPNLRVLNLEGSIVSSLRDLGCDIITLKHLNVSRCGLKSFDGTNGLGSLEELVADFNFISDISPCCSLDNLTKLSLKGNKMHKIDSITFLELCPKLKDLNLLNNPITKILNYRNSIKQALPNLSILDEMLFNECQNYNEFSSSDYQSSSTSPEISLDQEDNRYQNQMIVQRSKANHRPATAGSLTNSTSELTSGQPYCGNIISRRRRRRVAWADSNDEAGDSSSNSSCTSSKSFPNQLPQRTVELELGVIGVPSFPGDNENLTTESLLEIARKWRYTSKTTRDTLNHYEGLRNNGNLE